MKIDVLEALAARCIKVGRAIKVNRDNRRDNGEIVDSIFKKTYSRRLGSCVCVWQWCGLCVNGEGQFVWLSDAE